MTAFAIDHADLTLLGDIATDTAEVAAYAAGLERACGVLLARGWEREELYWAQLFDLPTGRDKSALLECRDGLGLPTDPDAYLMCTPLGARISLPESF